MEPIYTQFRAVRDSILEKLKAEKLEIRPIIGAEESLPDEDTFGPSDSLEYQATDLARQEMKKHNINMSEVAQPRTWTIRFFDRILTINKKNVVSITKDGKVLLQQEAQAPGPTKDQQWKEKRISMADLQARIYQE